ncbi:MAG TPA: hypothetical protein VGB85_03480 [Nannocystis sp.]|jgi:hypothetical protein
MKTSTITRILVAFALVGLPACDGGGDTKKTDTKTVAKTDAAKPAVKVETKTDTKVADNAAKPDDTKEQPIVDPNLEKIKLAATVAREISGAPDQADEILGKHGLDRDKLDALMFEIAGDPELTQAYMAARRDS